MTKKRLFPAVFVLLLLSAWAPAVLGGAIGMGGDLPSYIGSGGSSEFFTDYGQINVFDGLGDYETYATPSGPGFFKQDTWFSGGIHAIFDTSHKCNTSPGPSSYAFGFGGRINLLFTLDQSGPIIYSDAHWSAEVYLNDIELTRLYYNATKNDLIDGISFGGCGVDVDLSFIIPIAWDRLEDDTFDPPFISYWGSGEGGSVITMHLTEWGNVVPLPASFLLLGSGLLALAGWRGLSGRVNQPLSPGDSG